MEIGDLVTHAIFGHHGIIVDVDLEIDRRFRYVQIHWITGNLSPIWFLDHELLVFVGKDAEEKNKKILDISS